MEGLGRASDVRIAVSISGNAPNAIGALDFSWQQEPGGLLHPGSTGARGFNARSLRAASYGAPLRVHIGVQQPTDHPLVLRIGLRRLGLEEIHALLARVMMTFTSASRTASSSGQGRKSRITFGLPIGSFVYLILLLMDRLSLLGSRIERV